MIKNPRTIQLAGLVMFILAALLVQTRGGLSQSETPQVFLPVIRKGVAGTPTVTPTATITPTATSTPTVTPTATLPVVAWLPIIQKPPYIVTSYYIQDESGAALYTLGCELGSHVRYTKGVQDSLVILNFGQMWIENGVFGTGSFTPYWHFIPLWKVEEAIRQYARGYYNCSATDRESFVFIGVGTNNFGGMMMDNPDQEVRKSRYYTGGQFWGEMVTRLNQWAVTNGYAYQVAIGGAMDIEWAANSGWNTPTVTRSWVDGFELRDNGQNIYFNFGACVGCPIVPSPSWVYSSAMPWTQAHIYYVSYEAPPAFPVPEIYRNDGYLARQWQAVSKYGVIYKNGKMIFPGLMTQWQACQQRDGNECTRTDGTGLDNTPEEGWQQLYTALNSDPDTVQEVLRWTTDIRWQIK